MKSKGPNCLICNCEGTMPLGKNALANALGEEIGAIHNHLCRTQLPAFDKALKEGKSLLVACTQEAPLFQEIAEENGQAEALSFVNIRETAGWSQEAEDASPKIAALLKSAGFGGKPARLKTIQSDGMCLVYGAGQQALEIAKLLSDKLSVTLLLSGNDDLVLPAMSDVPIYRGDIKKAEGSFGKFSLTVDNYAPLMPSARSELQFVMARDGATTDCSLILDMSGNSPLFAGHKHRDGYVRTDPGDPAASLKAVIALSDMVGEFEKPIYVEYNADTCAHGRSKKTGCTNCLDACPAGAISSLGDTVEIDSGICGGCGSCHSVCPTGSISYQYPERSDIISRAQTMLSTYLGAGGNSPVLLVHGEPFGTEMISAVARFGRGLPAKVIPYSMHAATTFGHVEMAAVLASGAAQIMFLADPKNTEELAGLEREIALCNAITDGLGLGETRVSILNDVDPDKIEEQLWSLPEQAEVMASGFVAGGTKRDVARLAFSKLREHSSQDVDIIALPTASPYGIVEIDQNACTLCMACTSACPASAIVDTPGEPKLRFTENACVQCGLCTTTCPENALSLKPQLNFTPSAMQPTTLYEEEPFCCIVCDTPFATQSTITRISEQLAGKHSMFANSERANLIKMCENCRVEAQANSSDDPFKAGDRPRVRTTEDYIAAESGGLTPDDFLIDD